MSWRLATPLHSRLGIAVPIRAQEGGPVKSTETPFCRVTPPRPGRTGTRAVRHAEVSHAPQFGIRLTIWRRSSVSELCHVPRMCRFYPGTKRLYQARPRESGVKPAPFNLLDPALHVPARSQASCDAFVALRDTLVFLKYKIVDHALARGSSRLSGSSRQRLDPPLRQGSPRLPQ